MSFVQQLLELNLNTFSTGWIPPAISTVTGWFWQEIQITEDGHC